MDAFLEAFWGEEGYEHLRKYTRNGSDFFKEVIGCLEERVELEEQYSKGLQKLAARLAKAAKHAVGHVDTAWKFVAAELDNEAVIHRSLGTAIEDEIVKPLKTVHGAHQKTRKMIDSTVEKSIKQAASRRSALEKAKKSSHNLASDLEKVAKTFSQENRRVSKQLTEKQSNKLSLKRCKLEESSWAADKAYHELAVAAERQRQELELVLSAAALRIETLEQTRLANFQTALGRYHCHLSQLGPALTNARRQHFQNRIDPVLAVDIREDLKAIICQSQPSHQQAYRTMILCDFYAEDFSNPIGAERRKEALTRCLAMFEKAAGKENESKRSSDQLTTLYEDSPLFSDVQTKHTLRNKLTDKLSVADFLDYHLYKISSRLEALEQGPLGTSRTISHTLSKYESQCKDKIGLRQTLLRIPLPTAGNNSPNYTRPNGAGFSISVPAYEKRQAGDGQSPPRKLMDEDENESTYEHLDCVSSVDTFSETSSSIRGEACQALYDFEPQQEDQLAIYAGDLIRITEKTTEEWWQGEVSGRVGLFPASYVKELS